MGTTTLPFDEQFELRTALEAHMAALTAQAERLERVGTTDQKRRLAQRMGRVHNLLETISG